MTLPKNILDGYQWLVEEKGFQLIKLQRGKKVPVRAERGWASRTTKRPFKEVKLGRNDNTGVLTGRISGVIVLDIDDAVLFPQEHEIPDTFTVRTAKGFHHYYRLPEDAKQYGNRARKSLGFDIRGDGGYVVAPWSRHPDGITTYTIINDAPFADAPQWILDLAEGTARTKTTSTAKAPKMISISKPPGFTFPPVSKLAIESLTAKGRRSEKIWQVINELVELECSDEDILFVFESHPGGIGEKYFEKGAGRANWLKTQMDKARDERDDRYAEPVEAKDQLSVDSLTKEITDFIGEGTYVNQDHKQSIRDFANLLISLYEGSVTGWYAVPIPVGGGKTMAILHFIKFLYEHDTKRNFPISVAFEKIKEIEKAAKWLEEHGVPDEFYQVVHHKVPDLKTIFRTLPSFPVILHTHQKLTGSSYVDDYFKYDGRIRRLLIFDESMVNAMVHSGFCRGISAKLSTFVREYEVSESFQEKIPEEICKFFNKLNGLIAETEKRLNASTDKEVALEPDTSHLDEFEYGDLVRYSRIIEGKFGETDLYRDILLASHAPQELRKMSLIKGQGSPAMFVTKELLDEEIENLVTTDASREFRRLFRFSQRTDGKKVKIYRTLNFRWDDELGVWCIPLRSGRETIQKTFEDENKPNQYLDEIVRVVKKHDEVWKTESEMDGKILDKPKYLFFYSKQIKTIPYQVQLRLLKEELIKPNEIDEQLHFETFGQETATDKYKECEVVIFIGLLHKPPSSINALLAGEGFIGDPDTVRQEVEIGELLHQLQQGIGRGRLRKGGRQFVYFFHHKPEIFRHDIQKAFQACYYNGKEPDYIPDPYDGNFTTRQTTLSGFLKMFDQQEEK